jgi:hypothetical protein
MSRKQHYMTRSTIFIAASIISGNLFGKVACIIIAILWLCVYNSREADRED